jgi:hypothetical protein
MNMQQNTTVGSSRSGDFCGLKTRCAALLAALILVPAAHGQAEEQPPAKAWSVSNETSGSLYSMNFEGGSVGALKSVWMNSFTNDNFLITPSAEGVNLRAFQIRDMTLTELARSIAFLSQGALTVGVVEHSVGVPGNIWRVSRPSPEALSQKVKIRAVAAPHLFANKEALSRFLEAAEAVQRQVAETFAYLEKLDNSMPLMSAQIRPLEGQRVFVLVGTEEGISGIESLIKAAEQTAAEPVKEAKSGY